MKMKMTGRDDAELLMRLQGPSFWAVKIERRRGMTIKSGQNNNNNELHLELRRLSSAPAAAVARLLERVHAYGKVRVDSRENDPVQPAAPPSEDNH